MIEEIFLFANIICSIGTILLIRAVIKDRKILTNYSLSGAFLTLSAVFLFDVGFGMMKQWLSALIGLITVAYWAFVVGFKVMYRRDEQ